MQHQSSPVKFNLSEKNEMMRELVDIENEDGNCNHILDHWSREKLNHFVNLYLDKMSVSEMSVSDISQMCQYIIDNFSPRPFIHLDRDLLPAETIFKHNFFRFSYFPQTGGPTGGPASPLSPPFGSSFPLKPPSRENALGSRKDKYNSRQDKYDSGEYSSPLPSSMPISLVIQKINEAGGNSFASPLNLPRSSSWLSSSPLSLSLSSTRKQGGSRGDAGPPAWNKVLGEMDKKEKWMNKIFDQLKILGKTKTGEMILKMIATYYSPGEILVTNENPSQLSANVYDSEVNIPSVPRFICYYDPEKNLINSQMWMALGHELIHLIHSKLGIHDANNSNNEEENTVQGVLMGAASLPPHPLYGRGGYARDYDEHETKKEHQDENTPKLLRGGFKGERQRPLDKSMVVDKKGHEWRLTENQFRKEHKIPFRNGYDSIPVCSTFEKSGCDLFNDYGDDTCIILQDKDHTHPEMKKRLDQLITLKKNRRR
jgi:hypothetical protein